MVPVDGERRVYVTGLSERRSGLDQFEWHFVTLARDEPAEERPRIVVARFVGGYDIADASVMRERLEQGVVMGPMLVDLSACSFLDSSIIACLVHVHQQQGFLAIVRPPRDTAAARALTVSGMTRIFSCVASVEQAVEATLAATASTKKSDPEAHHQQN